MEDNHQESYKMLVKDINPLSYKDVAEDWETNSSEWYHALVAIEDLPIDLVTVRCTATAIMSRKRI